MESSLSTGRSPTANPYFGAGYVANALEQALLLPGDIADLRFMKKHEVFLTLKKDLALVSAFTIILTDHYLDIYIFISFYLLRLITIFLFVVSPFFFKVVKVAHRAEELVNSSHKQMKEKEGRHFAAMDAFNVAEKRIQELNKKLTKADRNNKSVETALERAKR